MSAAGSSTSTPFDGESKMKKHTFYSIGLVAFFLLLIASCSKTAVEKTEDAKVAPSADKYHFEDILVAADMDIGECELRQLCGRILFVTSQYCPHCKKALPVVEKLIDEKGFRDAYEHVGTSEEEGRDVLEGAGLQIKYVPTLIIDCKAFVGGKHADNYGEILSTFKR